MPFEPGDTEETLRARGLSDIDIELIRKYHTPLSMMSPEDRAKGEAAARKWIGNNVK